jgi:hypothetical protein
MSKRIFMDNNIMLDVLGERKPFYDRIAKIATLKRCHKMRLLMVVILAFNFQISFGQKESMKEFKNVIEIGATTNIIPNFTPLAFNGWGDNKFHTAIFGYNYKRHISPKLYVAVNFSYLWSLSRGYDPTIFPQQTNVIGKNLAVDFGRKFENVLPKLEISTSVILGVQDVAEKSLIYYKPDYNHVYFENVGDRGLLTGVSVACDYKLTKRFSAGVSSSLYHRIGFSNLVDYYSNTNRPFHRNFIFFQPTIGFHF